ncbi:TetR/AcrR family transcriptional regulator [Nonomuraea muscovyensis]|uniref:AcrR family transcriptional regulator n=1 Tax=Nonomuraea muscovyensis TaxID=1124761 RepID=A0A7X0BW85_9ACTN|nr:TetR/AcrR family transcriptional regulator [Nonomuraea muscovyensis]MBB6344064.1 AcrR family transcriptional regulator [Nonomuraea muscovyensis]
MVGMRERKKQRTRRALIEAALRLFAEKGYEETTLAEIAAEADVSTRTFFSYFASKEDVVFFDSNTRMERLLDRVTTRKSDEPLPALLLGIVRESVSQATEDEGLPLRDAPLRMHLIMNVPALQARALHLLFDSQLRLARALHDAYPDQLDAVEAAAAVGALTGAAKLAVMASIERGDPMERAMEAAVRAAEVALRGLDRLGDT